MPEQPRSNVIPFPLRRNGTEANFAHDPRRHSGRPSGHPSVLRRDSDGAGWHPSHGPAPGATKPQSHPGTPVTLVSVEFRGWRTIAQLVGAGRAGSILDDAIDRAVEALAAGGATDITLAAGPGQPVLSSTFEGADGAIRALRAAAAVREAVAGAQSRTRSAHQFHVSVGVASGETSRHRTERSGASFSRVGAAPTLAGRLAEFAGPGQVFLSDATYAEAADTVSVRSIGDVRINAMGERCEAFLLTGNTTDGASGRRGPWAQPDGS